jgi:hypothetical protein
VSYTAKGQRQPCQIEDNDGTRSLEFGLSDGLKKLKVNSLASQRITILRNPMLF